MINIYKLRILLTIVVIVISITSTSTSTTINADNSNSNTAAFPLYGGSYQYSALNNSCIIVNSLTGNCICPPTFQPQCYSAITHSQAIINQLTLILNNPTNTNSNNAHIDSNNNELIDSRVCFCGHSGLSPHSVYGGLYQLDDPIVSNTSNCRHNNNYTNNCNCPVGYNNFPVRTIVYSDNSNSSLIGSNLNFCINTAISTDSISIIDESTFGIAITVINNFHGFHITSGSRDECININPISGGIRTSRYQSSIGTSQCNCPINSCIVGFSWLMDSIIPNQLLQGFITICESSLHLPIINNDFANKVLFGYQQWQNTPLDGKLMDYIHWTDDNQPLKLNAYNDHIDVFPDHSEYNTKTLQPTLLSYIDNTTVSIFSSYFPETTELHFNWLYHYGLDGFSIQRFLVYVLDPNGRTAQARNEQLKNDRINAELLGRLFNIMYDASGCPSDQFLWVIKSDIPLLQSLVFNSPNYVTHMNKPLIDLFGCGHRDELNVTTCLAVVEYLHSQNIMVRGFGTSTWRTDGNNSVNGENFLPVYLSYDIMSPWAVGSFNSIEQYKSYILPIQIADREYLSQYNKLYSPVVFPGFSWYNMHKGSTPLNQIPRLAGQLLSIQYELMLSTVLPSSYFGAMFDEIDEGTSIHKGSESKLDLPVTGHWVSYDIDGYHIPNDHYLCINLKHSAKLNFNRIKLQCPQSAPRTACIN